MSLIISGKSSQSWKEIWCFSAIHSLLRGIGLQEMESLVQLRSSNSYCQGCTCVLKNHEFYWQFIHKYSEHAQVLEDLTKTGVHFVLHSSVCKAVASLQASCKESAVSGIYAVSEAVYVFVDASDLATPVIMYQRRMISMSSFVTFRRSSTLFRPTLVRLTRRRCRYCVVLTSAIMYCQIPLTLWSSVSISLWRGFWLMEALKIDCWNNGLGSCQIFLWLSFGLLGNKMLWRMRWAGLLRWLTWWSYYHRRKNCLSSSYERRLLLRSPSQEHRVCSLWLPTTCSNNGCTACPRRIGQVLWWLVSSARSHEGGIFDGYSDKGLAIAKGAGEPEIYFVFFFWWPVFTDFAKLQLFEGFVIDLITDFPLTERGNCTI